MPRDERRRIFAAVCKDRVATDARDAANAAAYAEWIVERTTSPRPLVILEVLFPYGSILVLGALLWPDVKYLFALPAYTTLLASYLYARLRRREKLVAARDRNNVIAEALGGRPNVEFPARDPNKPSPFEIRREFAMGVALLMVVVGGALALVAISGQRAKRPSAAVRAMNAACERKEEGYRELRAAPPSIVDAG